MKSTFALAIAFAVACSPSEDAQQPAAGHGDHEHAALGTVEFETSCAPEVQDDFEQGMAALHSFAWGPATRAFESVLEQDADCAMAHWGLAMVHGKIAWGPAYFSKEPGLEAIRAAKEIGGGTERERGFIEAGSALYEGADSLDIRAGVRQHAETMKRLHEAFPEDDEVALFYALALLASAAPGDTTYAAQREAGAIAERVFAELPDHPGPPHYMIHAFDYPQLAELALDAARRYSEIAPEAPHARHMPSHIYARLGLWDETIASNRSTLEVADESPIAAAHAYDYLVYAHMQRGEPGDAKAALADLRDLGRDNPDEYDVVGHVIDAHARFLLESEDWETASAMEVDTTYMEDPRFEAIARYVRAIGAARTGDAATARAEIEALPALEKQLEERGEAYPAANVAYWKAVADAWIAHAEGNDERAIERMRQAVALDEETVYVGSFEFGPDAMVHAREEMGDLLMEMGRTGEAREAYEAALANAPNRRRALEGMEANGAT